MSKRHDYTASLDNHENFKRSAVIAGWFVSAEDKPYVVLIGTKLARLASLLIPGKVPNNESIDDTFLDLVNYCALWMERRTDQMEAEKYNVEDRIELATQKLAQAAYPPRQICSCGTGKPCPVHSIHI